MLIDWFTVLAQIVNFLVLVALLNAFLFKPILKRVDERKKEREEKERKTLEELQEAENKRREYEERLKGVEKEKGQILELAKERANENRESLLQEAREEVERKKEEWFDVLKREQKEHEGRIKKEMESAVLNLTHKILHEFAGTELQDKMLEMLLQRLQSVDRTKLPGHVKKLAVLSSFDISDEWKKRVEAETEKLFGDLRPEYQKDEELLGGLVLEADSYRLLWSPYHYLEDLSQNLGLSKS